MPRPLVFGNGSLLIACDERHRIRDLAYPRPGQWNHVGGKAIAWGVWVDGAMHWTDGPEWQISMAYRPGAQAADCTLVNHAIGIEIHTTEASHPSEAWFVRSGFIRSLHPQAREVRIFWNHELLIHESQIGNTALFHPSGGMMHYKGNEFFLFLARSGSKAPDQWSCGVRMQPADGSWTQCQSGVLNGQSAEVGAVDSTMGITLCLEALGQAPLDWGMAAFDSLAKAEAAAEGLLANGMESVIESRLAFDRERLASLAFRPIDGLPEAEEAARRAVLTIASMSGQGGEIIAACDSDIMTANTLNYCNVWPRDGSLVADAMLDAGDMEIPSKWLLWASRVLARSGEQLFRQKYWPDGELGVSWHPSVRKGRIVRPVQVDETSLTLSLACRWKKLGGAACEVDEAISAMAEGLLAFRQASGLPEPSWDLWEERRGVSLFGAATTIAALAAAGEALGREDMTAASDQMRQAVLDLMVGSDGAFVREISEEGEQDASPDSAMAAALLQGAFDWDLDPVTATIDKVRRFLLDQSPSGGCARYDGDYYHRQSEAYPGSPWIISTLWLAQIELKAGGSRAEALRLIRWVLHRASETGILPESCHPVTGEPLSVSPLTWSHAELLRTLCLLEKSSRS